MGYQNDLFCSNDSSYRKYRNLLSKDVIPAANSLSRNILERD